MDSTTRVKDNIKAWYIFGIGSLIIITAGAFGSIFYDKGDFLKWLAYNRISFLDYYFFYTTQLAEFPGFFIAGVALWFLSWRKMVIVPVTGLAATIISYVLKNIFSHERPSVYLKRLAWEGPMEVLNYHMIQGNHSFPSGHSLAAWALATYVVLACKKPWVSVLCLLGALTVSMSRVYLLAHFLQDVTAGAAIGVLTGIVMYRLYLVIAGYYFKRKPRLPDIGV